MSFLNEIIASAEKVELEEINKKTPELSAMVENIKTEVIRYMENVYVKYSNRSKDNQKLLGRALEVKKELNELKNKAEFVTKKELPKSSVELKNNIDQLSSIDFTLEIILNLQYFHQLINLYSVLLEEKNFLKCVEIIKDLEEKISSVPNDEYLDLLNDLKEAFCIKKNSLRNKLKNIFTDNITINTCETTKTTTLKIQKENEEMKQALLALYFDTSVIYPLNNLARKLWDEVFIPVVDYVTNIKTREEGEYSVLEIVIEDSTKKSDYTDVFSRLKVVLEFLDKNLNFDISIELTTLEYIGNDLRENLSELIIKHCLQDTIPSNEEGLHKYKIVIEDTKGLEEVLLKTKIFNEETASLFEYANNIDVLFINKKCQEYLSVAQNIMKSDLHDMTDVGVPYEPNNPLACGVDEFLQCFVSKNVLELLKFAEKILVKALTASDLCAGRLFCTVQNIFSKYGYFVPEHHKRLLQTIPQQIALFHNNCLYISYVLCKWDQTYCSKFRPVLNACCFTKEISNLKYLALEMFNNYVESQIKQINDIMDSAGLDGNTIEKLEPITEKHVRQCLRQQELLKTVWHQVLSYPIYNKTLGDIFNSLCDSLIKSIIKFEDIPSDVAEQLVEIIKIVETRGPKLFTDPKEVPLYVISWYKLQELKFVLSSSLLDINDRWADSKGPLALQFTSQELKQLIRALFQNTERRAAILAKI